MQSDRYRVYISYVRADVGTAKLLRLALEGAGVDVFLDVSDIQVGVEIRRALFEAIRHCQQVVVIVSPAAKNSGWLSYEVGVAEGAGITITPVLAGLSPGDIVDMPFISHLRSYSIDDVDQLIGDIGARASHHRASSTAADTLPDRSQLAEMLERALARRKS